jgi:preprotein translocase subunit SecD
MLRAAAAMALLPLPAMAQQPDSTGPRIEMRHTRESAAPGFVYLKFAYPETAAQTHPMAGLFVAEDSFWSEADIEAVGGIDITSNGLTLSLVLTPEGSSRLWRATSASIGGRIAILLDSRLLSAPLVASAIGGLPDQVHWVGLQLPLPIAHQTAARIRARWPGPRGR